MSFMFSKHQMHMKYTFFHHLAATHPEDFLIFIMIFYCYFVLFLIYRFSFTSCFKMEHPAQERINCGFK